MQIVKYAYDGATSFGILEGDRIAPADCTSMADLLDLTMAGTPPVGSSATVALGDVTLLAPIDPDRKLLAVALNYAGHIRETGIPKPASPLFFFKSHSSLIGDGEPIKRPENVTQLDYEGELCVVISKEGYGIDEQDAWQHVGGITALNDTSARDLFKIPSGASFLMDWMSCKSLERSSPLGPSIMTLDEAGPALRSGGITVTTRVNDRIVQQADIEELIFDIPALVSFASSRMRLHPGDIIATGTPHGVGAATGEFLNPGDRVDISVGALPVLRNAVI